MSVRVNDRGVSSVKYLDKLMELEIFILRAVVNKPKRYRYLISDRLVDMSVNAFNYAKQGNTIYPQTKQDFEQRRVKLWNSLGELQNLNSQISIAYSVFNQECVTMHELEQLSAIIEDCNKLLRNVIKSDFTRYKELIESGKLK